MVYCKTFCCASDKDKKSLSAKKMNKNNNSNK